MVFANPNGEAMRIDSSGNLLVGTTDTAPGVADTNVGVALNSGRVFASAEADYALNLNRNTNDGDIVRFRKDGTTVGSLGVIHGNNLFIGAPSHSGLQFGTSVVYPTGGSTGDANDATLDIGASGQRFKDLYLSGNTYVGNAVTSSTDGSSDLKLEGNQHIFRKGVAGSYAERMRIDSSGNVGIGATSANSSRLRLDNGGTSGAPQLMLTATGASTQTEIRHDTSNNLIFENWNSGRTERMRIDSSGDVRIGSITNAYGFAQKLRVGDGDDNDGITINSGSTHQGNLAFCHGAGGNTAFGRISYQHNSNYMAFFTNNTERMRIDSSGDVLIGNTTVNPASAHSDQKGFGFDTSLGSLEVAAIGGSAGVFGLNQSANTDIVVFRKQGTQRGSVYISDGGTTYNTSSDARLKNVLGEAKGLEIVNKLNAVNFEWKESKEIQDGLIAQEVEELIPHAVSKNADGYYQMDYSMVVTPLIKAIQEQQEQIDALQSEINLLKGE
jgi:hypothetical protein